MPMSDACAPRPALGGERTLTTAELSAYRRDGHVTVRGLLSRTEIEAYREAITAFVTQAREDLTAEERRQGGSAAKLTFDLTTASEAVIAFVRSSRLGHAAAQLAGAPAMRLFHYHGYFKPPGGYATPWHRDCYFTPLRTDDFVTAWIPLCDLTSDMGAMQFARGSHLDPPAAPRPELGGPADQLDRLIAERGYPVSPSEAMATGDVSFHNCRTLHCAPRNRSARMRAVITIGYYPDGTRLADETPPDEIAGDPAAPGFRRGLLARYFGGLNPGDEAAGPLNPVVYPPRPPAR